mgnify:CR=1 FL=1
MFSDKRRGDIWWMSDTHRKPADTCLIRGDRPVIVVSSDSANQTGSTATVVPMTSSPARRGPGRRILRQRPSSWATVSRASALPRQVHGADRADLQQYLGHLDRRGHAPPRCSASGARSDYDLVHGIRGFDRGGHRQRYRPAMCQSPGYDNGGLLQHSQPCPGRH